MAAILKRRKNLNGTKSIAFVIPGCFIQIVDLRDSMIDIQTPSHVNMSYYKFNLSYVVPISYYYLFMVAVSNFK